MLLQARTFLSKPSYKSEISKACGSSPEGKDYAGSIFRPLRVSQALDCDHHVRGDFEESY